jgi:hypothetical protein
MSIDKVPIPAFLYQSLFGKNLVNVKAETANNPIKASPAISFLGGNEKKIIFLVDDAQNKFLADGQVKLIYDLLTACQLTMADIALVNFSYNKLLTYKELTNQLQPKKVLIFGVSAGDLGLPFTIPFFQIQNFQEQVYMLGPAVHDLQLSTELRKQLWACLQKIFNIQKQK